MCQKEVSDKITILLGLAFSTHSNAHKIAPVSAADIERASFSLLQNKHGTTS